MKNNNEKEEFNNYLDNPNLQLKKILNINDKHFQGYSINRFDYFSLNKVVYIAIPSIFYFGSNPLCIYKLNKFLNFEKILSLEGHKNAIILVKNFFDEKNNKNYLLTSDTFPFVLIWEIENENSIKIKQTISIYNEGLILSALIIFEPINKIILTSNNESLNSCEFSFNSGNFIRYIPGTKNKSYHSLVYQNNIIIELCKDKIYFYNLLDEKETFEIKNEITKDINIYGCIINNILYVNNFSHGKIIIINLSNRNIINVINTSETENLFSLIEWNKNYLIATDNKYKFMYIFDIIQMKIINKIKTKCNPTFIKKINLDMHWYNYENILLILDNKFKFEFWIRYNDI